jgi:hypothetical protein
MPGEDIYSWSTTAADNNSADSSIDWSEGMPRASVNNSGRSMMAAQAKDRDLTRGMITAGGVVNALTFSSGLDETSVPIGLTARLKIETALRNTAACTLNMDNIGAVAIINNRAVALGGGELIGYQDFRWDGTNWVLLGAIPTEPVIRVFTASGTYPTATNPNVKVMVYCKGGGGSGGSSNDTRAGGGGGEGAEAWKLTTSGALSGQAVTVGAGAAASVPGGTGGFGSGSSVGSIISVNGGSYGNAGHLGGNGGTGGAVGTCDWGMPGAAGHTGGDFTVGTVGLAAAGGGKGGGGHGGPATANSGGGGGGANSLAVSGAGGSGIVVCTEYGAI